MERRAIEFGMLLGNACEHHIKPDLQGDIEKAVLSL